MGKVKIWVIDDDKADTFLAKVVIRDIAGDADIMTFSDGNSASAYLSEHIGDSDALPDLILLDINMPGMDGWDFLDDYAQVADHGSKRIRVYMLSSSIAQSDLSRAESNPLVTAYYTKPLEAEQFEEIYRSYRDSRDF